MRKQSLFFIILFFIFQSVLADNASSSLEKLMGGYTSYQANFAQTSAGGKGSGKTSYGKVYMLRPGRFRWETTKPYQQTVIANGNTLWIYDVDLAQATKQPLAQRGFNPAQLLTEPAANMAQKFTITQQSDGWYMLTPKKPDRGFKAAYLQFQNNQLTGLKIVNQLNQTNQFTFSQIRINPSLSPGLFNFKPPTGVQVLSNKSKTVGAAKS